jgi:hypothetical protein
MYLDITDVAGNGDVFNNELFINHQRVLSGRISTPEKSRLEWVTAMDYTHFSKVVFMI